MCTIVQMVLLCKYVYLYVPFLPYQFDRGLSGVILRDFAFLEVWHGSLAVGKCSLTVEQTQDANKLVNCE